MEGYIKFDRFKPWRRKRAGDRGETDEYFGGASTPSTGTVTTRTSTRRWGGFRKLSGPGIDTTYDARDGDGDSFQVGEWMGGWMDYSVALLSGSAKAVKARHRLVPRSIGNNPMVAKFENGICQ